MKPIHYLSLPTLALTLLLGGCKPSSSPGEMKDMVETNTASHEHPVRGVVEKVAKDQKSVIIHHEDIPGYMESMTMNFKVKNPAEVANLKPGDQVTFTLEVTDSDSTVKDFKKVGESTLPPAPETAADKKPASFLQIGDVLPDAELIAENGKTIHLSDYRGKVLVFTFFFTRCPLPDYCPLVNKNFAATRQLLLSKTKAPANWQFLSISFDPDFDQPKNLAGYALAYRGANADRWLFAAMTKPSLAALAPQLGLMIMGQDGTISHNLRTVVVSPEGKLAAQFNDNKWTPEQLADAISAHAN